MILTTMKAPSKLAVQRKRRNSSSNNHHLILQSKPIMAMAEFSAMEKTVISLSIKELFLYMAMLKENVENTDNN